MSTLNKKFSLFFYLKKQNNEKRETAIELFHQHLYDLVLLSAGIEPASEIKLRKLFALQNPDIKIIQHGGGSSGLLENEIRAALINNEEGNFNIVDNPFN